METEENLRTYGHHDQTRNILPFLSIAPCGFCHGDDVAPCIYEYVNCTKFLQDSYKDQNKRQPGFSYEFLRRKAGISSRGLVYNLVHGARKLSRANTVSLCRALGLLARESEYFEAMVGYTQATTPKERSYFHGRLDALRQDWSLKQPHLVRQEQYKFYAKPYHATIRLLLQVHRVTDTREGYRWLASNVSPAITPAQAQKSVELLQRLGLIRKGKTGILRNRHTIISTPPEVRNTGLLNYHIENAKLAIAAMREKKMHERNISGLTLAVSKQTYDRFCDKIASFRRELLVASEKDNDPSCVYRLNLQFFPVSKTHLKKGAA